MEWGKDCDMPEEYWQKQWTAEEFVEMNRMLHKLTFDLNVMRCQLEQFERYGTGPLKKQFDRSPDKEVRQFMMSLKTARAIKFVIYLRPRTLDELCEYSAEEWHDAYADVVTKAVIAEIEETLAECGKQMKKGVTAWN
ncbi:MAG: hypothetical protein Ta2A_07710 [Treponemataceae bacterium]|nr:MAG: hypothetical protein Ta2A_07710 [Treponemataceae bacterium]